MGNQAAIQVPLDACASDSSRHAGLIPTFAASNDDSPYANTTARRAGDSGGASRLAPGAILPDLLVGSLTGAELLVAVVGPTGSGKSALAVRLAEALGGAVVNYDSVQLYRGFDIGAAKPTLAERRDIPHYLLDCLDPGQVFTAGDFRREAARALEEIRAQKQLPILVGGTGLYLRALLAGLFDGPARSEALRERLRQMAARRGPECVHRLLARLDPASASRIGPRDLSKTIRAVEVCLLAGQPISALHRRGSEGLTGYRVLKIGFDPPRRELYQRIERRVEAMFQSGLIEETARMMSRPDAACLKPLGALGYRQAGALIRQEISHAEAISQTQKATRHYAKRQMTWFRREPDVAWFRGFADDPAAEREAMAWLRRQLEAAQAPSPARAPETPGGARA